MNSLDSGLEYFLRSYGEFLKCLSNITEKERAMAFATPPRLMEALRENGSCPAFSWGCGESYHMHRPRGQ